MCRFGACPDTSRARFTRHRLPSCRPTHSARAHFGTILSAPYPVETSAREATRLVRPSAVAWSGRVRHVECRAWRIIGTRTRFRSCVRSCRPQSGCCLLVADRRQQVLHELGPVGLRARGAPRAPFRGRRPRGGFRHAPVPRRWWARYSPARPGHSRSAVCHPSCADLRGDRDRRRAVRLPRAPRRCDLRRLDPRCWRPA